jgi:COMPASS component SWD3
MDNHVGIDPSIASLALLHEFPSAHVGGINDLAFTHDDRYLFTASDDKSVIMWDLHTLTAARTYKGHAGVVFCISVNQGGNLLVSGSYDETIRLWDVKTAKVIRTIKAHSDPVSAVDFNKDGSLIVSSSYDGLW